MPTNWRNFQTLPATALCCLLMAGIAAGLLPESAKAQKIDGAQTKSGYLCCNMRVYNDWISDINYRFNGTAIIPPGTKAWVREVGRYSFTLAMAGKIRSLGNDYSRSLSGDQFLARYLVKTSPRELIRTWDQDVQDAVRRMRVMVGMTEKQVLTAIGYPPHNYTQNLKGRQWKYWLDRSSEFTIHWSKQRTVQRIEADKNTRRKITHRPKPAPTVKPEPTPGSTPTPAQKIKVELQAGPMLFLTDALLAHHQELRSSRNFMNTVR